MSYNNRPNVQFIFYYYYYYIVTSIFKAKRGVFFPFFSFAKIKNIIILLFIFTDELAPVVRSTTKQCNKIS